MLTELDFLRMPIEPASDGVERVGDAFVVRRPWEHVRFGEIKVSAGWWKLECEGDGDAGGVEVRLTSASDPLIVFPATSAASFRFYLRESDAYEISLLVSPWPKRVGFRRLRLRRLSLREQAELAFAAARRLGAGGNPLRRIVTAVGRIAAGHAVGVNMHGAPAPTPAPFNRASGPAAAGAAPAPRLIRHRDIDVVLGADDRLHPSALEIVEREFERSPHLKAIYCDCSENGRIVLRTGWDPELARWCDIAGLPIFFRGGEAAAYSNPWARLMALVEKEGGASVERIALPLVERPVVLAQPLPPLREPHLSRFPKVSVIIPTKLRLELLEQCLQGLAHNTDYRAFEVIVVDNGCEDRRFADVIAEAQRHVDLTVVQDLDVFNFSRLINVGVAKATGEIVLLLNDDVTPVHSDWMGRMVSSAMDPAVGAVGARLTYPDGAIQHAGVMLGLGGICGHLWKGVSAAEAESNPHIVYPGSRLAVTAACLAVRRELFSQVGGMDAAGLAVSLNDIDLCLRLHVAGYRNVYRGDAVLVHHESQSRGPDDANVRSRRRLSREAAVFLARWRHMLVDDPFGSPGFDRTVETGAVHRALVA